ncbi:alpha-L-rhamnosidase-related protein [Adhaeribacter radiodurans]|uniref:Glycogen debranching protein n=1 Tax=Adhaeribacter radiodurans TaxID=2745197 RepID=A0A7L7LBE7_9BACT|nr:amylo-alpha-1,6-glucosidase [Adhaeribacter radiodurans]QMU30083.1 glycogen debranching protein [Adhaeribacter radiodurans]
MSSYACQPPKNNDYNNHKSAIWQSEQYAIYPDKVVQQEFAAHALSPTKMTSNYKSKAKEFQNPKLTFKFSINGKDNEMVPGEDHQFTCIAQNGTCETPLITFGEPLKLTGKVPVNTYLPPNTKLKIRLDMRQVLEAFNIEGFFTTYNGDKIYKEDFKGVFVAGNPAPLTWDFDNLANYPELELKDPYGNGIFEVTLLLTSDEEDTITASNWELSKEVASFPQYSSNYPVVDALYNLSLEEMVNAIEPDSTFRTGKEWSGVWTRDISYSIILSMAILQPEVARISLLRKVTKHQRIIQDTGTGGAYPISSDRIVWAIAAWELYKVTGDINWLKESYQIIKNSLEDDLKNVYNPKTGLFRGESSFLDWREQTYPEWMQPTDIFESECLGTNAVFYQASSILAQMAEILNEKSVAEKYRQLAEKVKKGINEQLWLPENGYYGQYVYGRNFKILSPKAEALGEALCVLFDIADSEKQQSIVAKTPVTPYGIPCIYPQIPNIPPYHNNAVWPFVQSYWSLAAAKVGNKQALTESISAIYRPAALLLTNKENFVASNGDYAGTQINSSNMLWSLAGNLSLIYKVIFGMDFQPNCLQFKPVVPQAFAGNRTLKNFKYRQTILDIYLEGHGNKIKTVTLDNKAIPQAEIPAHLTGRHVLKIELENNRLSGSKINKVAVEFSPISPEVSYANGTLSWEEVADAKFYKVVQNGKELLKSENTSVKVLASEYSEYQVIAVTSKGHESFASEPLVVTSEKNTQLLELEKSVAKAHSSYKEASGIGFIEISKDKSASLNLPFTVAEPGIYAIDFRYANGEGPINTNNKCAIRTLKINDNFLGTIVLPQRGSNEWSDWGFSNAVQVKLEKGTHQLTLAFEPVNENMNEEVNRAMLDCIRLTKITN